MAKEKGSFKEFLSAVAPEHQAFVEELNSRLIEQGCDLVIKEAKSGYAASYQLEKKTIMNWVFRRSGIFARIYGDNAGKYEDTIASLPVGMQEKMTASRDCKRLIDPNACSNTCVKGFVYALNGDTHKKCRNDGMIFLLTNETAEHIAGLVCAEVAARKLDNLSLTGRLCYLFMCIEKYLTICYPERNWEIVAKKFWQWTNVYWNEGCDTYSVVVPEYLFEFSDYEKINTLVFDGMLPKGEYLELTNLFAGLTNGNAEDEINQVLILPIKFNDACECTDFEAANTSTLMILYTMHHFLSMHNIPFPSINNVQNMTVDQRNGWGNFIDSEYLSIIIRS